jgi:hypothetical protein
MMMIMMMMMIIIIIKQTVCEGELDLFGAEHDTP